MSNQRKIQGKANLQKILYISVFQNGATQCSAQFPIRKFFEKKIQIGGSPGCEIYIPFAPFIERKTLFKITGKGVYAVLEIGYTGYINTGTVFGQIADFISPQGTLVPLPAMGLPTETFLGDNARGKISVGQYDIAFKIETPKKIEEPKSKSVGIGWMSHRYLDHPMERQLVWFSLSCAAITLIPLFLFFSKYNPDHTYSIKSLSEPELKQFIAPKHYQLLPWFYETQFQAKESMPLAVDLVIVMISQLLKRWHGDLFNSDDKQMIESIGTFTAPARVPFLVQSWLTEFRSHLTKVESEFYSSITMGHRSVFKPPPEFVVETAGRGKGSLNLRLSGTLTQINRLLVAVQSMEKSEFEFVKSELEREKIKLSGVDTEPELPSGSKAQVGTSFLKFISSHELALQNYKDALEIQAEKANLLADRTKKYEMWAILGKVGKESLPGVQNLLLDQNALVTPRFYSATGHYVVDGISNMIDNVELLFDPGKIPEMKLIRPSFSQSEMLVFLESKKEEIRACYESRLIHKPGLAGKVEIAWVLGLNGRASEVRFLSDSLRDPQLANCLRSRVLDWNFPKPKHGSVMVKYPFRFVIDK